MEASFGNNPKHDFYDKDFSSSSLHSQQKTFHKNRCAFCDRDIHFSNNCLKVTDPKSRKELVKQRRLCFVCLQKVHSAASCKKYYSCKKLVGKHNISICTFTNNTILSPSPNQVDGTNQSNGTLATANKFSNNKNSVLLQTASVPVSGFDNKRKVNNAQLLFDSGSQRSYISEDLRKKLNLPTLRKKKNIAIHTFGNKNPKFSLLM